MQGAQQQYEKKVQEQAKKQQVEQYRQSILLQILAPEAKDRCNQLVTEVAKIKLVKPEKVQGIQNSLIQYAQSGMLKNKVSEAELIALLQKENASKAQNKVTFKRRGIDDQW